MLPKVAIRPAFEGTKQAIVCLQRRPSMLWNQPVVRPGLTDLLADGVVSDAMARCTHMASGRVSEEATNTAPKDQLHREGVRTLSVAHVTCGGNGGNCIASPDMAGPKLLGLPSASQDLHGAWPGHGADRHQRSPLALGHPTPNWAHDVTVSTLDSESSDPVRIPGWDKCVWQGGWHWGSI